MKMEEVIAQINAYSKKAKETGLTEEEIVERDKLRRIFIDSVTGNLRGILDNTTIVEPDGTKRKLKKKQ